MADPHQTDSHALSSDDAIPVLAQRSGDRLVTLDAIRGVAVMGILLMNIISFSMPLAAYFNPLAWGGTGFYDKAAYALSYIFIDSKMRGLFSLLFGASTILVIDRATAKDENGGKIHFARMLWLFLLGLCHMYFIWHGDILTLYAMCGMILFLFINFEDKTLIKLGVAAIALSTVAWLIISGAIIAVEMASNTYQGAETTSAADELSKMFGTDRATQLKEVATMRGSYAEIFNYRADKLADPFGQLLMSGMETIGLMLIGAGLMRQDFFADLPGERWPRQRLKRAIYWLMPLSFTVLGLQVYRLWTHDFPSVTTFAFAVAFSAPFDFMIAVGYAAVLVLLFSKMQGSKLLARLAATGRAAFTNYLGTSIVMTTIFYGYGLGLFGQIDRAPVYLFVLGAAVIMLAWSEPWLKRFHYGPLEWLWRSLARMKLQPMLKRKTL